MVNEFRKRRQISPWRMERVAPDRRTAKFTVHAKFIPGCDPGNCFICAWSFILLLIERGARRCCVCAALVLKRSVGTMPTDPSVIASDAHRSVVDSHTKLATVSHD